MFIPDLGACFLSLQDPGSWIQKQEQKRRMKKFVVISFCVATNIEIITILFLNWRRKHLGQFFKEIYNFLPKIVTKLPKYGSGIRDSERNYSGSRIPNPGYRG
jgi:hypothetical protein